MVVRGPARYLMAWAADKQLFGPHRQVIIPRLPITCRCTGQGCLCELYLNSEEAALN